MLIENMDRTFTIKPYNIVKRLLIFERKRGLTF